MPSLKTTSSPSWDPRRPGPANVDNIASVTTAHTASLGRYTDLAENIRLCAASLEEQAHRSGFGLPAALTLLSHRIGLLVYPASLGDLRGIVSAWASSRVNTESLGRSSGFASRSEAPQSELITFATNLTALSCAHPDNTSFAAGAFIALVATGLHAAYVPISETREQEVEGDGMVAAEVSD